MWQIAEHTGFILHNYVILCTDFFFFLSYISIFVSIQVTCHNKFHLLYLIMQWLKSD